MAVFFGTGDLGDVGRHVVEAALAVPASVLGEIRVFSKSLETLSESNWSCGCQRQHGMFTPMASQTELQQRRRLVLHNIDISRESVTSHLVGVDVIISCLGNRTPFHSDYLAKVGTANILQSMAALNINHILMLSSVGISEDWPPLEWAVEEGKRLQGHFRTICWMQYQDLSAAEILLNELRQRKPGMRSLVVRAVLLNETDNPTGHWYVQQQKNVDHPNCRLAKMDCACFLVQEAIQPTIVDRAIVLGGVPPPADQHLNRMNRTDEEEEEDHDEDDDDE
ncbi:hypothetical protein ACA910_002839 [Epithemia clementina (nom. ined.)]